MFIRNSIGLVKSVSKRTMFSGFQQLNRFVKYSFSEDARQEVKIHDQRDKIQRNSVQSLQDAHAHESLSPKDQLILDTIDDYKKGLEFYGRGKYRISLEFFRRTAENIKKQGQQDSSDHLQVLKKMVSNQIQLLRYQDAEMSLEEIIQILQKKSSSETLIYKEYNNLFLHCLKYNLNKIILFTPKAIMLGKALLSEQEKKKIPPAYLKMFTFNLGTAYLLKGNFVDAKQRLRECITQDPHQLLRGYALNNLALACWWHKHPNYRDLESDSDDKEEKGPYSSNHSRKGDRPLEYSLQQIDADFDNVIPLLKKAIWHIENADSVKEITLRTQLKQLLDSEKIIPADYKKFDPAVSFILTNPQSGIPLTNIQEFLFHTHPHKTFEASFWFKYALKLYEQLDPNNIDRCLITLGVFCISCRDYEKAEALFKQALNMIGDIDNSNKMLCLQMYGGMLVKNKIRSKEGEQFIAQAHLIGERLPFWFNKINHTIIPDLDLS